MLGCTKIPDSVSVFFVAGIRRTLFGLLILHRLALQSQRVVYQKHGVRPRLFCADGAFWLADVEAEIDIPNTWWMSGVNTHRHYGSAWSVISELV